MRDSDIDALSADGAQDTERMSECVDCGRKHSPSKHAAAHWAAAEGSEPLDTSGTCGHDSQQAECPICAAYASQTSDLPQPTRPDPGRKTPNG